MNQYQKLLFGKWTMALWCLLLAVATTARPVVFTENVDHSWMAALLRGARENWQYGRGLVFTYGPTGFVFWNAFAGDWLIPSFIGAIVFKGVAWWLVWNAAKEFTMTGKSGVMVIMLFAATMAIDAFVLNACLLIAFYFIVRPVELETVFVAGAFLGFAALAKGTFMVTVAAVLVISIVALLLRCKKLVAGALLAFTAASFIASWLLTGQHLRNLRAFIKGLWEISSGYTGAMQTSGRVFSLLLAVGTLVALLLACVSVLYRRNRNNREAWLLIATIGAICFIAWKLGMVRASDHAIIFFLGAAQALLLLSEFVFRLPETIGSSDGRRRVLLGLAGVVLCCGPIAWWGTSPVEALRRISNNLIQTPRFLLNYENNEKAITHEVASKARQWDAAGLREITSEGAVDVYNYQLARALIPGVNYIARPVIQGYAAFTPYLAALNRRAVVERPYPTFFIMDGQCIEGHFLSSEDPLLFIELMAAGALVGYHQGRPIIRYYGREKTAKLTSLGNKRVHLGERVSLPQEGLIAIQIRCQLTGLGLLANLCYKVPTLRLEIEGPNQGKGSWMISREMASTPFLITPLVSDASALNALLAGHPKVGNTIMIAAAGGNTFYTSVMDVEFFRISAVDVPERAK